MRLQVVSAKSQVSGRSGLARAFETEGKLEPSMEGGHTVDQSGKPDLEVIPLDS